MVQGEMHNLEEEKADNKPSLK